MAYEDRGGWEETPGAARPDPDDERNGPHVAEDHTPQPTAGSRPQATPSQPPGQWYAQQPAPVQERAFEQEPTPAPEPDPAKDLAPPQQPAFAQWYPQQPSGNAQWYQRPPDPPRTERPPAAEDAEAPPAEAPPWYASEPAPPEPQPQKPQDPYPQDPYPQDSYRQDPYPQDSYPQDPYPQQPNPQGPYPQNLHPQGQEPYADPQQAAQQMALPEVPNPVTRPPVPQVRDPRELVGQQAHGDSLIRRVGHGVAHAFRPAEEVQTAAKFGEWVQHPVTTGRRIAVTSIRGGAGKSTVAALLATVYGHYRQDPVLALDVDPGLGSLALRLGITPAHSLGDLAATTAQNGSFEELQPYLTRAGKNLWVLPGTRSAVHDSPLDAGTYQNVAAPLNRLFGLTVVDCGAGLLGDVPRAVLSGAHAQILVTHTTYDGAVSAREALDWMMLSGYSELVHRTVVVFVSRNPDADSLLDLGRATALVQERGAGAVWLRYDRHVALGSTLDARRMAYATRLTGVRIAAEAMRRAIAS
ncbi:MinD/ParA family protein [Actinomadura sp. HBU206391]|uniref:nucleotide-binding protein n=1 Tax=Actinomadura sp. HBU206391 TaxID=2731692 RepID=UPI001650877F|nr:MinD/ParA family protein [Actinomadura sp. HBU206391]MBC6459401.1 hypothetical protein [Actinomadura sp. HBU206391]